MTIVYIVQSACISKYMEKNARPLRNSIAVKGRFRIATYQKVQSTYGAPIVPYGKLGLGELLNPVSTNPLPTNLPAHRRFSSFFCLCWSHIRRDLCLMPQHSSYMCIVTEILPCILSS